MNEFKKARLNLTVWYILISVALLSVFTIAAISSERKAFSKIQQALSDRVQRPKLTSLLEQRLNEFDRNYIQILLTFDVILLILASAASYFLSGETLKPIKQMVENEEQFAGDVSHELRTPLSNISLELESINRNHAQALSPEVKNSLHSIYEETDKMKRIINGLLSSMRAVESLDQKNRAPFDLELVLKDSVAKMQNHLSSVRLKIQLGKINLSENVFGNKEQIGQVLVILLDNAIKFTPEGSITVSAESKGKDAIVRVRDTGKGIHAQDIPHIFDRFFKSSEQEKGMGLGLHIARKIIESHGGKITVESRINEGTEFTFTLPHHS